ncbi:MAG: VWA domain-containing protein, partial [Actinobacteria bacterium]|nr:VWA domain-containing protein [Actinomycetota bacterium]
MNDEGVIDLVALLRPAGLAIPVGSVISFVEAVGLVNNDLRSMYWAGRATLAHSPVDIELYDLVFRHWILGTEIALSQSSIVKSDQPIIADDEELDSEQKESVDVETDDVAVLRFSRTETLHSADFASLNDDERAEADRVIATMRISAVTRASRRRRPSRRSYGTLDLRRTIRESLRTGGEPLRLRTLQRTRVPRRVVIIADISGSMASYSRSLIRYAHAAVSVGTKVEA